MPYRFLDDVAPADAAFEATAPTLETLIEAAWDATLSLMIEDAQSLQSLVGQSLDLSAGSPQELLFDVLSRLIYFKDAEGLLLRLRDPRITEKDGGLRVVGELWGEPIDQEGHVLGIDVKAVTLHRFRVEQTAGGWEATVVLDL